MLARGLLEGSGEGASAVAEARGRSGGAGLHERWGGGADPWRAPSVVERGTCRRGSAGATADAAAESLHQDQALRCTCCTGLSSRPCEFPMRGVPRPGVPTWQKRARFDNDIVDLLEVGVGEFEAGGAIVGGGAGCGDRRCRRSSRGRCRVWRVRRASKATQKLEPTWIFPGGADAVGAEGEVVAEFELDAVAADVPVAGVEIEAAGMFDEADVEGAFDDFDAAGGFEVAAGLVRG